LLIFQILGVTRWELMDRSHEIFQLAQLGGSMLRKRPLSQDMHSCKVANNSNERDLIVKGLVDFAASSVIAFVTVATVSYVVRLPLILFLLLLLFLLCCCCCC
jgi:hypothetical protein